MALRQLLPAILGGAAAALAIPLGAYFLAPGPMYHFVLISCSLLLIVHVLHSRGWW